MSSNGGNLVRVVVQGKGTWFAGLHAVLEPGGVVVVGRSRTCDESLRKSQHFRHLADKDEVLRSREFNRVSRIHCELTLVGGSHVEIRDLSSNGTWVDGERVHGSVLADLSDGEVEVAPVEGALGTLVLRGE